MDFASDRMAAPLMAKMSAIYAVDLLRRVAMLFLRQDASVNAPLDDRVARHPCQDRVSVVPKLPDLHQRFQELCRLAVVSAFLWMISTGKPSLVMFAAMLALP